MLMIKLLISLAIVLVMAGPLPINSPSIRNSVTDKEVETLTTVIDKSVVSYYVNHAGTLPDALDENVMLIMGLDGIDMDSFTYVKVDDDTFRLIGHLTSGNVMSANSGIDLMEIEPMT